MKRRDFLERVSELAKGSVATITLSKLQIAAAAGALTAVVCSKENPVINTLNIDKNAGIEYCGSTFIFCSGYGFECDNGNHSCIPKDFGCTPYSGYSFSCQNGYACNPVSKYHCNDAFQCDAQYTTGAAGGT